MPRVPGEEGKKKEPPAYTGDPNATHLAGGRWHGPHGVHGSERAAVRCGRRCQGVVVCMYVCAVYAYVWAYSCIGPRAARHEKMCVVGAKFARNLQW